MTDNNNFVVVRRKCVFGHKEQMAKLFNTILATY